MNDTAGNPPPAVGVVGEGGEIGDEINIDADGNEMNLVHDGIIGEDGDNNDEMNIDADGVNVLDGLSSDHGQPLAAGGDTAGPLELNVAGDGSDHVNQSHHMENVSIANVPNDVGHVVVTPIVNESLVASQSSVSSNTTGKL